MGIMYPVVTGSSRYTWAVAEERCGGPPAVPTTTGYMMPDFHHNLVGIGPICDHGCRVVFEKTKVTIFSKDNIELLRSWRETTGSKMW